MRTHSRNLGTGKVKKIGLSVTQVRDGLLLKQLALVVVQSNSTLHGSWAIATRIGGGVRTRLTTFSRAVWAVPSPSIPKEKVRGDGLIVTGAKRS